MTHVIVRVKTLVEFDQDLGYNFPTLGIVPEEFINEEGVEDGSYTYREFYYDIKFAVEKQVADIFSEKRPYEVAVIQFTPEGEQILLDAWEEA